jgi:hypothetical protein
MMKKKLCVLILAVMIATSSLSAGNSINWQYSPCFVGCEIEHVDTYGSKGFGVYAFPLLADVSNYTDTDFPNGILTQSTLHSFAGPMDEKGFQTRLGGTLAEWIGYVDSEFAMTVIVCANAELSYRYADRQGLFLRSLLPLCAFSYQEGSFDAYNLMPMNFLYMPVCTTFGYRYSF